MLGMRVGLALVAVGSVAYGVAALTGASLADGVGVVLRRMLEDGWATGLRGEAALKLGLVLGSVLLLLDGLGRVGAGHGRRRARRESFVGFPPGVPLAPGGRHRAAA